MYQQRDDEALGTAEKDGHLGIYDKDPFIAYKLRFKRHEMEFLDKDELARIECRQLENPMLCQVRDLFILAAIPALPIST